MRQRLPRRLITDAQTTGFGVHAVDHAHKLVGGRLPHRRHQCDTFVLHKWHYGGVSETVGIRELRQNASGIISAAEAGQAFHVTVRGKDTGVVIAKQPSTPPAQRRRGITLDQIEQAGIYAQPTPAGYEEAMLELVERGRDESGRIGDRNQ